MRQNISAVGNPINSNWIWNICVNRLMLGDLGLPTPLTMTPYMIYKEDLNLKNKQANRTFLKITYKIQHLTA